MSPFSSAPPPRKHLYVHVSVDSREESTVHTCHCQASCQVLLLFPQTAKAKDKPRQPSNTGFTSTPCSPQTLLFLFSPSSDCWQTQKEAEARPMNVPRLNRGDDDEDDRAEVRGEEDLRSGSGCYFTDKTPRPLPLSQRQLGRGVASFVFSLLVFSSSLMLSMRALYELEEGYEVPFGCH
ncbi:hypothetical protein PAMP_016591 [Pampus punctatissimus]